MTSAAKSPSVLSLSLSERHTIINARRLDNTCTIHVNGLSSISVIISIENYTQVRISYHVPNCYISRDRVKYRNKSTNSRRRFRPDFAMFVFGVRRCELNNNNDNNRTIWIQLNNTSSVLNTGTIYVTINEQSSVGVFHCFVSYRCTALIFCVLLLLI